MTNSNTVLSTQPNSWVDVLPQVDATSEVEPVQNPWSNDYKCSTSQASPAFAPETCLHPTDNSSTTTHAHQTTELQDEEYGEFVEASTDPLKRPMYDTTKQEDEALKLLDSKSTPVGEADSYMGMGMVEPVHAGINMATRRIKTMARWKRNDSRANMIVAEHKRKRLQRIGGLGVSGAGAAAALSSAKGGVTELVATSVEAESNQYLQVPRAVTFDSNMNGVVRPVHFAGSAIDEMVTERTAWGS